MNKKRNKREKKMDKQYEPENVEKWYNEWEKSDIFKPESKRSEEKMVMMLPPPNVTGKLHIGHALTGSIQDCIIRYNKMMGKECLYLPGVDHAGIATQAIVEKKIRKEGKRKEEMGREKFIEEVWKWKEEYGGNIEEQLRRMGYSLDWSRKVFTLDEKRSRAVEEAFIRLEKEGLIYKDKKMINWSCELKSAISNTEIEKKEIEKGTKINIPGYETPIECGYIYEIGYRICENDEIVKIETTRPEMLLGNTGLICNEKNEKYRKYIGKYVINPINQHKICIKTDNSIKEEEGMRIIIPAHDSKDYELSKKHKIEIIQVFNEEGYINCNSIYDNLPRFNARYSILNKLKEEKLLFGKKSIKMELQLCSRSGDIIENFIKPQWFFNCQDLAKRAIEAVKQGELTIYPQTFTKQWYYWLENIQEWCISRQLWWGHQIPVYYYRFTKNYTNIKYTSDTEWKDKNYITATSYDEAIKKLISKFSCSITDIEIKRDEDVLDTWFSSGLFPFASLGWPENTEDLEKYYPNTILETGEDILFFWVARMVMMGYALTDKLPFKQIILHPMIRDKFGEKMSKSKGNVIDPLHCINGITLDELLQLTQDSNLSPSEITKTLIQQKKLYPKGILACGSDALRFTLLNYMNQINGINMDINRLLSNRKFCNKIWQAYRFCFQSFEKFSFSPKDSSFSSLSLPDFLPYTWLLNDFNTLISNSNSSLSNYDFHSYTQHLYSFFINHFCDFFIELSKIIFRSHPDLINPTLSLLYFISHSFLPLAHPALPFLTEQLWSLFPHSPHSSHSSHNYLLTSSFPQSFIQYTNQLSHFPFILDLIRHFRSLKSSSLSFTLYSPLNKIILPLLPFIISLSNISSVSLIDQPLTDLTPLSSFNNTLIYSI